MNLHTLNRRNFLSHSAAAVASVAVLPASAQNSKGAGLPVTVANTGGPLALCFQEIIKRKGYYESLGLNVTTVNVSDSAKIISSLIGGDTDICMISGVSQVLPAIQNGARLKVVAAASALAPISLFSSKPEIKTLKDLEGKVIGTGAIGAALHQIAVALFQKRGVDVSKIRFVNVGAAGDILKAVISGVVDAGTVNVEAYEAAEPGKIHPIADYFTDLAEYPYQGSFTTDQAIRNKREQLVRVLAAYTRLYRFIQSPDSRDEYVAAYVESTGGKTSGGVFQWQFIQKYKPYAEKLVLPDSSIKYLQEVNVQTGVQRAIMPANAVADMSLAEQALKLV